MSNRKLKPRGTTASSCNGGSRPRSRSAMTWSFGRPKRLSGITHSRLRRPPFCSTVAGCDATARHWQKKTPSQGAKAKPCSLRDPL
eukprot:9108229-Pyramimonas_sp.AAC.1